MQRFNLSNKLNFWITILLATIAFTPFLNRNVSEIAKVLILALWCCTAFTGGFHFNNKVSKWWLLFLFYQAITVIVGHSNMSINTIVSRTTIYSIPIMVTHVVNNYSIRSQRNMQRILLIVLLYNVISNVIIGIRNPDIYNTLNVVDKHDSDLLTNAGSTSFVSICLFTIPLCWILVKYGAGRWFKIICAVLLVASAYFMVFVNSRATALLLLIIIVFGYIIPIKLTEDRHNTSRKYLLLILILIAIYLGFIPFLELLAKLFANMDGMAGRLSTRMLDIIQFIQLGADVNSMGDGSFLKRILLWQTSWNTFIENMANCVFGIGEDVHLWDYYSLLSSGVGSHSTILDCLAQYGIIGGFFLYKCFTSSFNFIKHQINIVVLEKRFELVIGVFVIYSILNISLTSDLLFMLLFLYPLTFSCIKNE